MYSFCCHTRHGLLRPSFNLDQDAYWGLALGIDRQPRSVIGPLTVNLLLGGPIIAGATLSRFFALHVFVIPGLLIAFVGVHLLMVVKLGINEWPMPGRLVRKATYLQEYHELTQKDGMPFVPDAIWKDLFFSALILFSLASCAYHFGPFGPPGPRIPPSFRQRRARIFSFCGFMRSFVPSGLHGDAGSADRTCRWDSCSSSAAIFRR